MAFAQTADTQRDGTATHRMVFGTFTQGNGDTGGDLTTGLTSVSAVFATGMKSWSASGGTVTIVTLDPGGTVTGSWMAIGR